MPPLPTSTSDQLLNATWLLYRVLRVKTPPGSCGSCRPWPYPSLHILAPSARWTIQHRCRCIHRWQTLYKVRRTGTCGSLREMAVMCGSFAGERRLSLFVALESYYATVIVGGIKPESWAEMAHVRCRVQLTSCTSPLQLLRIFELSEPSKVGDRGLLEMLQPVRPAHPPWFGSPTGLQDLCLDAPQHQQTI